jgi:hypothetical protein
MYHPNRNHQSRSPAIFRRPRDRGRPSPLIPAGCRVPLCGLDRPWSLATRGASARFVFIYSSARLRGASSPLPLRAASPGIGALAGHLVAPVWCPSSSGCPPRRLAPDCWSSAALAWSMAVCGGAAPHGEDRAAYGHRGREHDVLLGSIYSKVHISMLEYFHACPEILCPRVPGQHGTPTAQDLLQ